jgi:ribonuclease R
MEERVIQLLSRPSYTPLTAQELQARLGVRKEQQREFGRLLEQLERSGRIARIKEKNCYALPLEADLVPGRIRMNRQGGGTLQPDDPKLPAIRISAESAATAINGDRVLVRRDSVARRDGRPGAGEITGKVIRILERSRTRVVGTLQQGQRFLYVIPDDPRMVQDILVPPPSDVGRPARPGDKVVVELHEWTSRHNSPEGEIIEVLGPPDAEGVDMLSVLRQYNLALHFPKPVLAEAKAIGNQIKPGDLAGRKDCRQHPVFTIDPFDAKDFDDAICLQRAGNNQWRLWVHIADVSHYVKPGTALDREAFKRGNSTYLVDRVVPMLPEALSNELCSLKPGVERLTKCVEFLLDGEGRVMQTQFYPAVIRSQRRYHYEEAFAVLQRAPADAMERQLHDAHAIAQKIRRARFQAGSLDLDFPEMKIRLDEQGRIQRIDKVVNDVSHQLIEEFMLLANEAVATRLLAMNRPAVHRIHEAPDEKRLREYREDLLAQHIQCGNLSNRQEAQRLLEKLGRLPIGPAMKIGFLRSLMRARYAVEALGHYGLAKKKYTHFTSPIRRYADLLVHRALFEGPDGRPGLGLLREAADHLSETERGSADAERDSRDVKLFAYLRSEMEAAQPRRFPAMITDVRNFGFFVEVEGLGMSGLVPVSGISDDFYQFDQRSSQFVGRRTRRVFKLGDRVEVQPAKIDTFKKQVDFKLAGVQAARAGFKRGGSSQPERKRFSERPGKPGMRAANAPRNAPGNPMRPQGRPGQSDRRGPRREEQSRAYGNGRRPQPGRRGEQRFSQAAPVAGSQPRRNAKRDFRRRG